SVRLDELLRFADGSLGFVMSLEEGHLAAVLLHRQTTLAAGMPVFGTGQVLQVPVGPALLGRVVDPLGRPLDDRAAPETADWLPVERPAPAIIERALVSEPLDTGVLIVDALFAIGRGQRELIIGDRATGKTSLALDAIINQKHSDVICVYVAVGQRSAAVQQAIEAVRRQGA
ncbi:MAG TPA: F0F1 ATP synthase subunit alpha, partial [Pseudomonas sp.]|nr:F0F1 ATP synthase subunit alpha [Pseudomonas sp.]